MTRRAHHIAGLAPWADARPEYRLKLGSTPIPFHFLSDAAIAALQGEHAAMLAGAEGGLGVARVAVTAGAARRALDAVVARQAHQARAGRTVAMLDWIILDDEASLAGEMPLLREALDVLVVLFRSGEGR